MDDSLRERIEASLDPGAPADIALARVVAADPEARSYAEALRGTDRALRAWPLRTRSSASTSRFEARIVAALEADAKKRDGRSIPSDDDALTGPPAFDDGEPMMETRPAMSDSHENDPDLENLAALTRTSIAPGAARSIAPALQDSVDDTRSGLNFPV